MWYLCWREKRNVFFSHSILYSRFRFQSIYKFHLSEIFYPVPTRQKRMPTRQNPDAYSLSGQLLPVGGKGVFGKEIVNYS